MRDSVKSTSAEHRLHAAPQAAGIFESTCSVVSRAGVGRAPFFSNFWSSGKTTAAFARRSNDSLTPHRMHERAVGCCFATGSPVLPPFRAGCWCQSQLLGWSDGPIA
eukprot:scaffold1461_cov253-Pinguiococcus_pyrenoidosus.AAC.21